MNWPLGADGKLWAKLEARAQAFQLEREQEEQLEAKDAGDFPVAKGPKT